MLHLGALGIVLLLNGLPWPGRLFLLCLVLLSSLYYGYTHFHAANPQAIKRLTWRADGDWVLETVSGERRDAQLLPNAYVHPWLVVLAFRATDSGQVMRLSLFRDAVDSEVFRRLRVRLRLATGPLEAGTTS